MLINYTTYKQLHLDMVAFSSKLPWDLVGIIGIPRSGIVPAAILSEIRHLPLGNLTEFVKTGEFMAGGARMKDDMPKEGRVLVLDDSIYKGAEMKRAFKSWYDNPEVLNKFTPVWAAVYKNPYFNDPGIITHTETHDRRFFEWNLMHHPSLPETMCDIDGVVCVDPPQDDDGVIYQRYLNEAIPLHVPRVKVHSFVTMRLEKWRTETENWFKKYKVEYGELIMCPEATAADRRAIGGYGIFKGRHYRYSKANLFIESCTVQAEEIARVSGKPVICITDGKVYQ